MNSRLNKKRTAILLCFVIVLALALRGAFFAYNLHKFKISGDARNYINMSHQLVDKGIYGYWYEGYSHGGKAGESNARVTPVYPLFVSAVYAVFHDTYKQITAIRLLQVLIGGLLTPLLAFLFARRILKRNDAALFTAFLVAVYPSYIFSTTQILTEVVALASMLLYFYLAAVGFQDRKQHINFLAGIAFAVQILIRPTMLPLFIIPFIYAWFTWYKDSRKDLIKIFIFSLAGFVVAMMPWWIRNYVILNSVILTADAAGNPLLSGTYPYYKSYADIGKDVPENIRGISKLQAEFAKERIIKGFTTEPLLYLKWYTVGKTGYMFKLPWLPAVSKLNLVYLLPHYFTILMGLLGAAAAFIKSRTGRLMSIYGMVFLGLYLIFIPENRYAYQMIFFLMLGASYAVCLMADWIGNRVLREK